MSLDKAQLAREVALDLPDGGLVNLGIGMPILVADAIDRSREIVLHSENGILGMDGPATGLDIDADLIDAGKAPVMLRRGGSFISHADSFALIRGGHIDVSVMGALQVSARGDLANWWTGEGVPGVGGAMDLAVGARRVVVIMKHTTPEGEPKLVAECSVPLTAAGAVSAVYTELGIFHPTPEGAFRAHAIAPDVTIEEIQQRTAARVVVDGDPIPLPRQDVTKEQQP